MPTFGRLPEKAPLKLIYYVYPFQGGKRIKNTLNVRYIVFNCCLGLLTQLTKCDSTNVYNAIMKTILIYEKKKN